MTLSINDTHNNALPVCHNAECHVSFIVRLNVFMLNAVILNVILLVVMVTNKLGC